MTEAVIRYQRNADTQVGALKEGARLIGKIGRPISETQAQEIEAAVAELQNALRIKGARKG